MKSFILIFPQLSDDILTEYAYFLKDGGKLYSITDVEDLHTWTVQKVSSHPSFSHLFSHYHNCKEDQKNEDEAERINEEDEEQDICVHLIQTTTEEGNKVRMIYI